MALIIGSGIRTKAEVRDSFAQTINFSHDLFDNRPNTTKLVLANHNGSYYCRKQFGKEVFFHTKPHITQSTNMNVEELARSKLEEESITLI